MIHFDDRNAGKVEKAINRAVTAFAIIVFPLSLLATIAVISQTDIFQPGPRMEPNPPKLSAQNWTPPILENALTNDGDTQPTPSPDARQAGVARLRTPGASSGTTALPTPTVTPTATPPGAPFAIFDDALASGWSNHSWGASVNFADTNPVYSGLHTIRYTATSGWAGLDLHAANAIDSANYRQLRFAMQATQAGQQFAVYLRDASGTTLTKVPLENYGGTPPTGTWKIYTIPLSDLGASNVTLGDVVFHEWSGKAQPPIYIDSIQLTNDPITAAPTPTSVPPTPTPTQTPPPTPTPTPTATATPTVVPTPTPEPSGSLTIYDDAFAGGWDTAQSWDATIDPNNTHSVYAGSKSISYTANSGWAGLQLWNVTGIDTSRFRALRFALHATQSSEPFAIYLRTSDYVNLTHPIPLSQFGGYPNSKGWTVYTIPLSALNASNVTLGGITIHDWSDSAQPAIYVDSIELLP